MVFFTEDFVNRNEHLEILWKAMRHEIHESIILVPGENGIGKTYLVEEFRKECKAAAVPHIYIDLVDALYHNYLAIVRAVRAQSAATYFQHLDETLQATRGLSSWETVPFTPVMPVIPQVKPPAEPITEQLGHVHIAGSVEVHGDFIGRDVNYIFQLQQRDDPVVQVEVQRRITEAFRACLIALTLQTPITFLFDGWEEAPTPVCDWLCQTLFTWILEGDLQASVAIVAGMQVPRFSHRVQRVGQVILTNLSAEAVFTYWIQKRGLSPEELPHVLRLTQGHPATLALVADRQAPPLRTLV